MRPSWPKLPGAAADSYAGNRFTFWGPRGLFHPVSPQWHPSQGERCLLKKLHDTSQSRFRKGLRWLVVLSWGMTSLPSERYTLWHRVFSVYHTIGVLARQLSASLTWTSWAWVFPQQHACPLPSGSPGWGPGQGISLPFLNHQVWYPLRRFRDGMSQKGFKSPICIEGCDFQSSCQQFCRQSFLLLIKASSLPFRSRKHS